MNASLMFGSNDRLFVYFRCDFDFLIVRQVKSNKSYVIIVKILQTQVTLTASDYMQKRSEGMGRPGGGIWCQKKNFLKDPLSIIIILANVVLVVA